MEDAEGEFVAACTGKSENVNVKASTTKNRQKSRRERNPLLDAWARKLFLLSIILILSASCNCCCKYTFLLPQC
jgi:hypothetical protein